MTYRTWSLIFVLAVAGQASALPAEVVSQKKVLVKKGENLVAVAERCGTSVEDLIKVNKLEKPYKIYIGQPLVFNKISNRHAPAIEPRGKKTVKTTVSQEPKTRKPVEKPAKVEPVVKDIPLKQPELPVPKQEPVPAQAPKGEPADVKVEDAAMTQPEIKRTGKQFSWPVEGKIISGFGKKKKGLKNDGINIAAKFQSPVKASEDGVVVYAGNEVRGFGNLVLIKHGEGWSSAYAHNDIILVTKGDMVKRGQVIAKSGNTGHVDAPQVHFELRQNAKPVDPIKHLN